MIQQELPIYNPCATQLSRTVAKAAAENFLSYFFKLFYGDIEMKLIVVRGLRSKNVAVRINDAHTVASRIVEGFDGFEVKTPFLKIWQAGTAFAPGKDKYKQESPEKYKTAENDAYADKITAGSFEIHGSNGCVARVDVTGKPGIVKKNLVINVTGENKELGNALRDAFKKQANWRLPPKIRTLERLLTAKERLEMENYKIRQGTLANTSNSYRYSAEKIG